MVFGGSNFGSVVLGVKIQNIVSMSLRQCGIYATSCSTISTRSNFILSNCEHDMFWLLTWLLPNSHRRLSPDILTLANKKGCRKTCNRTVLKLHHRIQFFLPLRWARNMSIPSTEAVGLGLQSRKWLPQTKRRGSQRTSNLAWKIIWTP